MTAEKMWQQYCEKSGVDVKTPCEAWQFGGAPDKLAELTMAGTKTATASAFDLYALEDEPLPQGGEFSVILNASDEAVCVIRTTKVYVVPFADVTADHAFKEGEGDRSLAYWREVHQDFFTGELKACDLPFTEQMKVVCEEFELVYQ